MDRELNKSELRAKLFELLKTLSFRRGKVTLASGRQSDYYFDTKPTMLDAVGLAATCRLTDARSASRSLTTSRTCYEQYQRYRHYLQHCGFRTYGCRLL